MSTFDNRLIKSGFTPIGLCSTLWIGRDGSFRGGFYLYNGQLYIVLSIDANHYYINEVQPNVVEVCLQGTISLFELATKSQLPYWWGMGKLNKATLLNKLILWWRLRTNKSELLPNYYYLWKEYICHA
jgi:hypothetical protein